MNKAALKNLATKARKELMERVKLQARKIGITKDQIEEASIESSDALYIDGRQLSDTERKQRDNLIARIEEIGFDRVIEETAYTWFNRLVALRFMEVNNYLPTKVRVLSSEDETSTVPDMIKEVLTLDLDIDKELVYELKMNNDTEKLFKYLITVHCNDLNRYLPFMFETIEDYMLILFPDGLLGADSFTKDMIDTEQIPEEDWKNVEIIGWLYQYYISEKKDKVFANLKKNIKITKDTLPAATQLFTPNWIVRYMVENSLGRIWLESYPDSSLKSKWYYYLDEAEQEEDVIKQLEEIRYKNVNPEEITLLDPACGSGHILIYAFEVFYDMYLEQGYIKSEIPKLILEKNLYGLDVDNRAAQLAAFAVLMKAREKSRTIFRQSVELNICSIEESDWLTDNMMESICKNNTDAFKILTHIRDTFLNAKEFGSLLTVDNYDFNVVKNLVKSYLDVDDTHDLLEYIDKEKVADRFPNLLKQSIIMSKRFDVVCTNPPYMGRKSMNGILKKYLDRYHKNAKNDLFASFIERGLSLTKPHGFNSMVTMQSWMFLSSYEKLRKKILTDKTISTLLHMDNMVMGIAFGTSATVFRNIHINDYKGIFTEVKYSDIIENNTPYEFPVFGNRNGIQSGENFSKIPGSPIAYWVHHGIQEVFGNSQKLYEFSTSASQNVTGNNNRYLRFYFEVNKNNIGVGKKWLPYAKGGGYRKWYGNIIEVINWTPEAREKYRTGHASQIIPKEYWYKKGITWGLITSSLPSFRILPEGSTFDKGGSSIFINNDYLFGYILGFLNSKLSIILLQCLNITLNSQVRDVRNLPLIINRINEVNNIVKELLFISQNEWNSYEISFYFKLHPILKFPASTIESSFNQWSDFAEKQFYQLKENEEELNRIFIEIYGLEEELTPDVAEEDVTVRKADLERDIKSFISYAVGCTLGRYSLDEEGLVYAGGEFDSSRYKTFPADGDNIIPILPGAYFEDDIVTRLIDFVRVTYGSETLEENLDFIADAIGRRKNETAREAIRRYFLNNFYKDHVRTYKKRPIYWLFTSGKEKAFNCLIYMHRYDKTTLSRIRTDYLHDVQTRYDTIRNDLLAIIKGDSTASEIRSAKKELKSVERKIEELKIYDEKLHHMADMQIEIDLDDGVKVNYEKFKGLVAKI